MTVAVQDRKPRIVRTTVAPGLTRLRATPEELKTWTDAQHAANTCMHCDRTYKAGSGGAWKCEHWHEGL